ncbi:Probable purine permease 10 [Linum grandiflorum]
MKPDPAPHHELQLQPITSTTGNEQGAKNDENGHGDEGREAKTTTWWWVKLLICAAVITVGQTATVLLGRLYFVEGGTSKWISFISQLGGFPMLIPYYIYSNFFVVRPSDDHSRRRQRPLTYGAFYVFQGLLLGGSTYLYTIGLQYLPVSTSSLIVSSQLGFNAFFSYFINSQRFVLDKSSDLRKKINLVDVANII